MKVRIWIKGEDYGTFGQRAADLFVVYHKGRHPDEPIRAEPVADDAPEFLPTETARSEDECKPSE